MTIVASLFISALIAFRKLTRHTYKNSLPRELIILISSALNLNVTELPQWLEEVEIANSGRSFANDLARIIKLRGKSAPIILK